MKRNSSNYTTHADGDSTGRRVLVELIAQCYHDISAIKYRVYSYGIGLSFGTGVTLDVAMKWAARFIIDHQEIKYEDNH